MFKVILNHIVYLNFIIATSAGILAAGIANVFTIDDQVCYGLFGFFSTLFVYNSQRLFKSNFNNESPWLKWVSDHRIRVTVLSIISGIIAGCFFILLFNKITLPVVVLICGAGLISVFYVVRIGGKSIREIPYVKIHSIAFTWTAILIVFPMLNENVYAWRRMFVFFIPASYIYFVAVAIPFDIRDLKYDSPKQQTIPQAFGVQNAKLIAVVFLVFALVGMVSAFNDFSITPMLLLAIITQIILVVFMPEKYQNIYCSVLIDGAISLLGISYLLL